MQMKPPWCDFYCATHRGIAERFLHLSKKEASMAIAEYLRENGTY